MMSLEKLREKYKNHEMNVQPKSRPSWYGTEVFHAMKNGWMDRWMGGWIFAMDRSSYSVTWIEVHLEETK